jgi:hypothetical protein
MAHIAALAAGDILVINTVTIAGKRKQACIDEEMQR